MHYAIIGFLTLALWVYCLVDIVTSPDDGIRHLPKMGWLIVVVLLPTIGALLWLFAGRPIGPSRPASNTRFSEYDRPGRHIATNPDDDEAFLRGLRERAEQQRREARRQQQQDNDEV
ncbi:MULTISPECIES: PLD nuclease N-terminal domain-containing protein [Nocardia]|uniref:Phospholipase D-like protein n=1 Tax=Nocardia ignorata TaxID=145285 RepID=A0A4R6P5E7_NOCIG|nr:MULTISPECIES: PLD nuclease N-terminal domain-containing protein [Nocardia]MCA2207586.1 PLD nuclease N-terminal domain-containing protein [Nocardia rosealba]TDP32887.1 phospholipase D-like protein [Nocardia ignorata]